MKHYYVYIMTNRSKTLYTGITWLREKKIALIESLNPEWRDLSEVWQAG